MGSCEAEGNSAWIAVRLKVYQYMGSCETEGTSAWVAVRLKVPVHG